MSHYLFRNHFGRLGKGKVEGLVKYARSNFMTPAPVAAYFEALNADLERHCRAQEDERAGRHADSISTRRGADRRVLRTLPAIPLEPCGKRSGQVSPTTLVRYRCNDYPIPTAYGFRDMLVKGFVEEVVILCAEIEITRQTAGSRPRITSPRCRPHGATLAQFPCQVHSTEIRKGGHAPPN